MLQADRAEYRLIARSTTTIRVTLTNTSAGPLYVLVCGPVPVFSLERRNGGRWTRAYDPVCELVNAPAIRVGRGEQRTFELIIAHDSAEPGGGGFLVREVTGDYRVALGVVTSAGPHGFGGRTLATPRARFSNVFLIVE